MDLHSAIDQAKHGNAANIVALRLYGRQVEIFRPQYDATCGRLRLQYREDELFQGMRERGEFDPSKVPVDAEELEYFVAPISEQELDVVWAQEAEVVLHRILGAPDPNRCTSPREKAAFTSWCIDALATRNG